MPRLSLEQTACVIERFLNALRLVDGSERTGLESILVRWLASTAHHRSDCVVYIDAKVICRSRGQEISVFEVPKAEQKEALWCNGARIEIIDAEAFRASYKLEMRGTEGLDFSMPPA
ncbi:MAG: hypothetical protein LBL72_07485 [Candidatus Accumulibacter sp.]|jgi:hypothetical protein|nr:hypothetical protein [Accumulibacter sp.]